MLHHCSSNSHPPALNQYMLCLRTCIIPVRFNLRVLECRLAGMLLAKLLATSSAAKNSHNTSSSSAVPDWKAVKMLKEVEAALLAQAAGQQQRTAVVQQPQAQLEWAVQQLLPHYAYQLQQVIT
jgi:hypothetical protein